LCAGGIAIVYAETVYEISCEAAQSLLIEDKRQKGNML
jgi:hypothetical protein